MGRYLGSRPARIGTLCGRLLWMAAVVGCTGPVLPPASAVPEVRVPPTLIAEGTLMHVQLDQRLAVAHNEVGQGFRASVTEPVYGPRGTLCIREGTPVVGTILGLTPATADEPPRIALRFDAIDAFDRSYAILGRTQVTDDHLPEGTFLVFALEAPVDLQRPLEQAP